MKLSILTPAYNRATLLKKLYDSIVENMNTTLDIEWLIMDDGSTDETQQVIHKWKEENKVPILYFTQENKGKMEALNQLMEHVSGDIMIECDSDDYFTSHAFSVIEDTVKEMDKDTYAMCYLKQNQDGANMGKRFTKAKTTMFDLYFKNKEDGEKSLVFNTAIRKQYKYELEKGERFVTEASMYHKMDLTYQIECVNEPILICEYQQEGYSNNILEVFKKNPYGYLKYFTEMFEHDWNGIYFKKRLYILKHYLLFSHLTNTKPVLKPVKGILNKLLIILLYVPAYVMTKVRFCK